MKKLFILAAIASVAFASCVKDENSNGKLEEGTTKMLFSAPVVAPATKAVFGEIKNPYSTTEKFSVFAVWTASDLATWGAGTVYMNNVETTYNSGLKGWAPATDYYWPKNGKLSFAAYSPTGCAGTIAYGATGFTITDFIVPAVGAQYDLMYSERTLNQTANATGTPYNGVPINFKHALSSILFTAKTGATYDGTTITLKSIKIDSVANKGTFAETVTDGATYTAAPVWGSQTGTESYIHTEDNVLTNTATTINGNAAENLILLPQEFEEGSAAKIIVTYTIKSGAGNAIEQTAEVKINTLTSEWQMGKRYTYNIILTLNKIYFAPNVEDWTDIAGVNINN